VAEHFKPAPDVAVNTSAKTRGFDSRASACYNFAQLFSPLFPFPGRYKEVPQHKRLSFEKVFAPYFTSNPIIM
jgi:hypothetical protein